MQYLEDVGTVNATLDGRISTTSASSPSHQAANDVDGAISADMGMGLVLISAFTAMLYLIV